MAPSRDVSVRRQTGTYEKYEHEEGYGGTTLYAAHFEELRYVVDGGKIKIRGAAVLTRRLQGQWRKRSFKTRWQYLLSDGKLLEYRDELVSQCLNDGKFVPSGAILEELFQGAEKELRGMHDVVASEVFPRPRAAAVA